MRTWIIILLMLIIGGSPGWVKAAGYENLTFYLPFEKDLKPRIAGKGTLIKFTKGTEQDAKLVAGRRGQGLMVNSKFNLQYLTQKSFGLTEGTIAFWMKPVGWSGVNHHRRFLVIRADRGCFIIYMYYGNPWFYVNKSSKWYTIGGTNWKFGFKDKLFPDGEWVFMAATYKPGRQTFYLNGTLVNSSTDGLLMPDFLKKGIVEISPGSRVMDEIMIFNRALSKEEIQAVYQANKVQ